MYRGWNNFDHKLRLVAKNLGPKYPPFQQMLLKIVGELESEPNGPKDSQI